MKNKLRLTLDNQVHTLESGRFPDGAVWIRITTALPARAQVMSIRATAMSNMDDFMCLAQLTEAVRHVCDVQFSHLELAYLPYARQDRHMQPGDSFALKVFANFLNNLNFNHIRVLDPHSEAAAGAINHVQIIPQQCGLLQSQILLPNIQTGRLLLVAPDAGALKKIDGVARATGATEYAVLSKQRDVVSGALTGFALVSGEVKNRDVLIVDDLCDAGGTFIGSAQVLREAGACSVSLYVSHGIFSRGVDYLLDRGIDYICSTTSYADVSLVQDRVELVDIDSIYKA